MTVARDQLGTVDPKELVDARQQAHRAVQWITRLARANLPAAPDDSHSNLGWDETRHALVSHHLAARGTAVRAGLAIDSMTLFVARSDAVIERLPLDGCADGEAGAWLDRAAARLGLNPTAGIALPYDLPDFGFYAHRRNGTAFAELARWFAAGDDILEETRASHAALTPSPVRCWPHHFDIATLLTLAAGHPETAPAIGIGLSPGDEHCAEPYLYMSPWPVPPVGALPPLPAPGRWHTDGFVSAIVPASVVIALPERRDALRRFIDETIALSRRLLAA